MKAPLPVTIDQHYDVHFFAQLWGLSDSTVLRMFQDKPGVLKLRKEAKAGKRTRVELRIPFSLALQVHAEHCK